MGRPSRHELFVDGSTEDIPYRYPATTAPAIIACGHSRRGTIMLVKEYARGDAEDAMASCDRCVAGFEPRREGCPEAPTLLLGIEDDRDRIGDAG